MEKLLIVISYHKPIPAVKNGAVEVLVENLMKYNENHHKYDITITSIYDKEAIEEAKKYKKTKIWFIKTTKLQKKIYGITKRIMWKLPLIQTTLPKELYQFKYYNRLRRHRNKFDKILFENVVSLVEKTKKISSASIFLHQANEHLTDRTPRAKEIAESLEKILVVSNYIGSVVKQIPGVSPNKVIRIDQGIDQSIFSRKPLQDRDEIRERLGIGLDDIVYEFHGRISPDKGVKELILAFSNLQYENVKLMIIGSKSVWTKSNEYIDELKSLTAELHEKVVYTGEVSHDQIPDYLHAADVAVLPPIWEEPASLAILESMIAGLPLITTNSGGYADVCDTNASYILPRDQNLIKNITAAMEELYLNPAKRIKMGEIAKEFGKKFTSESHSKQVFDVLSE